MSNDNDNLRNSVTNITAPRHARNSSSPNPRATIESASNSITPDEPDTNQIADLIQEKIFSNINTGLYEVIKTDSLTMIDILASDVVEKIAGFLYRHEMSVIPKVCKSWSRAIISSYNAINKALCYSKVYLGGGQLFYKRLTSLAPLFNDAEGSIYEFNNPAGLLEVENEHLNFLTKGFAGCFIDGYAYVFCRAESDQDLGEGMLMFDPKNVDVYKFNSLQKSPEKLPRMPKSKPDHAVLPFKNSIVVAGGGLLDDLNQDFNSTHEKECFQLDLQTKKWETLPDLSESRCYAGACVLDNIGYVIGGCAMFRQQQETIPPIEQQPIPAAPAPEEEEEDNNNELVWLPHPYNGEEEDDDDQDQQDEDHVEEVILQITHPTCEAFDPTSKTWFKIPDLLQARCKMQIVDYHGEVWVIGGQLADGSTAGSVEIYNPRLKTWREGPALQRPRQNHACFQLHGKLYAVGGQVGQTSEDGAYRMNPETSVEVFHERIQKWLVLTNIELPSFVAIFTSGNPVVLPWIEWRE